MFGIGAGEFIFILLLILMFFGSDKIPELARNLGKGMAQLRNATNDLKSEIQKGATQTGLDSNTLTGGISQEIAVAKEEFSRLVDDAQQTVELQSELDLVREKLAAAERELALKQEVNLPETLAQEGPAPEAVKRTL